MKTKYIILMIVLMIILGHSVQLGLAQDQTKCTSCASCAACSDEAVKTSEPNQTQCPVMGGKINKEVYTDYNGKRIYFCCAGCDEAFKKEPAKYLEKMEKLGVILEDAPINQTACPVSGESIDQNVFTDYQGTRVYFCCSGCKETFEKSPETYIKKILPNT